jgi:hypothetical protein
VDARSLFFSHRWRVDGRAERGAAAAAAAAAIHRYHTPHTAANKMASAPATLADHFPRATKPCRRPARAFFDCFSEAGLKYHDVSDIELLDTLTFLSATFSYVGRRSSSLAFRTRIPATKSWELVQD